MKVIFRFIPVIFCAALPAFADDQSDFASAPDGTWLRHNPFVTINQPASIDFSNQTCRITCQPPPSQFINIVGPARAGLFAPSVFSDTVVAADVTAWNPTTINRNLGPGYIDGTFIGVFTRVQEPISLLNLNGYSASVIDMGPGSNGGTGRLGRLQMIIVQNELSFTPFGGYVDFPLDPTHDYRLLLISRGDTHIARVFDLANPFAPVAERVGTASHFATGRTGIMILTDRYAAVDATFDNFLAWDGSLPPLAIRAGAAPGTIELFSDLHRSMASSLESATDLTAPAYFWQPAIPQSSHQSGNQLVAIFPIDGSRRFFRRKSRE
jgi:hypothetical protein